MKPGTKLGIKSQTFNRVDDIFRLI